MMAPASFLDRLGRLFGRAVDRVDPRFGWVPCPVCGEPFSLKHDGGTLMDNPGRGRVVCTKPACVAATKVRDEEMARGEYGFYVMSEPEPYDPKDYALSTSSPPRPYPAWVPVPLAEFNAMPPEQRRATLQKHGVKRTADPPVTGLPA